MIEYIKDIKRDLNGKTQEPTFIATNDIEKTLKDLDDFIRKLAFYETVLAKKKEIDEVEAEVAQIFIDFDAFVTENFVDGSKKADEIRQSLSKIYQNR